MRRAVLIAIVVAGLIPLAWWGVTEYQARAVLRAARAELLAAIQPVKLTNCEFERFGEAHDGGYVACRNLLDRATAAYSYGIGGFDDWGCSISARLKSPMHQYDCFNTDAPSCGKFPGARPVFHAECVGPERKTEEGRLFDTVAAQIDRNGDTGKRLIVKMDVEGAEWQSFLAMPDALLGQIDQLVVEFHIFKPDRYLETIEKLKRTFYIANLHWNNAVCDDDLDPLTSPAFEILFVNKSIAQVEPGGVPITPNPFDAPNIPLTATPDCQAPLIELKSRR
jgi:hypothetical protein